MVSESKIGQKIKAHCSNCHGDRNCEIHGHYVESEDDGNYHWTRHWYLLTCCGCDHVFSQSVFTDSESLTPYYNSAGELDYEVDQIVEIWPARAKRKRPEWFKNNTIESENSTTQLDASLKELYGALDHDLNVLSSIGIRTSFDIAAEYLGIKPDKTFAEKLSELVELSIIKDSDKDHIDLLIQAGSASAHRGWKPKFEDLDTMMTILEDFIFNNFVSPYQRREKDKKMELVKNKVPQKQNGKKS